MKARNGCIGNIAVALLLTFDAVGTTTMRSKLGCSSGERGGG